MIVVLHDALAVLSGLLVGVLAGLMEIGGGILLVHIMCPSFAFLQHVATCTSCAAIGPTWFPRWSGIMKLS